MNNNEECKPLPKNTSIEKLSNEKIEKLAKKVGAFKSPTRSKADVFVNGLGISIKSHRGANPAFLNHTHREGILKICAITNTKINKLDNIIAEYWNKRTKGIITEDVNNSNPESPFRKHKDYLKPILNYFLFTGSASGVSPYPADYILDFTDPINIKDWKFSKDEYIDENWDHFIFSIRSKGMPTSYRKGTNKYKDIEPWVTKINGRDKGSLHARVKF